MPLLLGCIADDLTGATDVASALVKQGLRTVQMIGASHGIRRQPTLTPSSSR